MISSQNAILRLKEGNHRFATDLPSQSSLRNSSRRGELVAGQQPMAIILGCSDSRVPAEIVFDQGLGDLFVIRVAGNIVAPSQIGSIEYAAEVTVRTACRGDGDSGCGAITATIDQLARDEEHRSRNLNSIVHRIRPSVETLLEGIAHDRDALIRYAVRANIRASVDHLRHGSQILEKLIQEDELVVVGAEYSLESGIVDFFDRAPK